MGLFRPNPFSPFNIVEEVEILKAKLKKTAAEKCGSDRFPSRKAAYDWLVNEAKVKRSVGSFYQDCQAGFPTVGRDGSVSRQEVEAYAAKVNVEVRGPTVEDADLSRQREVAETRKAVADATKAEMAVEELQRQADLKWVARVEATAQMAALVGSLRDVLLHHFHLAAPSLAKLVDGDPALAPQLYEAAEELIAKSYNEMAAGEIDVELEDD